MIHKLKTWPHPFSASWIGAKSFEIRKNDRAFEVYDEVLLEEWDPATEEYTGRSLEAYIEYISNYEQKLGFVVFQIHLTGRNEE